MPDINVSVVPPQKINVNVSQIRQVVVVKTGIPGPTGPSFVPLLLTQYSDDGILFHDVYVLGVDIYLRQSNNSGASWGPALLFIGPAGTPLQVDQFTNPNRYKVSIFDHFMGSGVAGSFLGGFLPGLTGGSIATVSIDGKIGILALSTSVTATANRISSINLPQNTAFNLLCVGLKRYTASVARAGQWYDNTTNTGGIFIGFSSNFGSLTANYCVGFRQQGTGNFFAVTRRLGAGETATDLGFSAVDGVYNLFDVRINSNSTSVDFYVNGVFATTITTNIPNLAGQGLSCGIQNQRISATAYAVILQADYHNLELDNTPQPLFS